MSGCVAAVDLATGAVIAHISDGDPLIAITPDGTKAFVAGSVQIQVIDTSTKSIVGTIPIGATAIAIDPTGSTLWAAIPSGGGGTLTPVDIATSAVGSPISLAYSPGGALAISGGTAYVIEQAGTHVMPVDLTTDTAGTPVNFSLTSQHLTDIAVWGSSAYLGAGGVSIGTADVYEQALPLSGGSPTGWAVSSFGATPFIAVTPDGLKVYATDNDDSVIAVVPLIVAGGYGTRIPIATGPSDIAITPDGSTAVVVAGSGIQLINLTSGTVVSTVALGGGHQVAITPDSATAYVTECACPSPSVGWRTGMIP